MRGFRSPGLGPMDPLLIDDACVKMHMVLQDGTEKILFRPAHQAADVCGESSCWWALGTFGREINNNGCLVIYCWGKVQDGEIAGVSGDVRHIQEIVAK